MTAHHHFRLRGEDLWYSISPNRCNDCGVWHEQPENPNALPNLRRNVAYALRRQGYTYDEIGKHFEVSRERARQLSITRPVPWDIPTDNQLELSDVLAIPSAYRNILPEILVGDA